MTQIKVAGEEQRGQITETFNRQMSQVTQIMDTVKSAQDSLSEGRKEDELLNAWVKNETAECKRLLEGSTPERKEAPEAAAAALAAPTVTKTGCKKALKKLSELYKECIKGGGSLTSAVCTNEFKQTQENFKKYIDQKEIYINLFSNTNQWDRFNKAVSKLESSTSSAENQGASSSSSSSSSSSFGSDHWSDFI